MIFFNYVLACAMLISSANILSMQPLHMACLHGNVSEVKHLLNQKGTDLNAKTLSLPCEEFTVHNGSEKFLVAVWADSTPLHVAVVAAHTLAQLAVPNQKQLANYQEIIEMLCQKAHDKSLNIDAYEVNALSPLHCAAESVPAVASIVTCLLKHGANTELLGHPEHDVDGKDYLYTPLQLARAKKNLSFLIAYKAFFTEK